MPKKQAIKIVSVAFHFSCILWTEAVYMGDGKESPARQDTSIA